MLPNNWFLWGLGWLLIPRFTIGLLIGIIFGFNILVLFLCSFGLLLDLGGGVLSFNGGRKD